MNQAIYDQIFKGFVITDAAIESKETLTFVIQKSISAEDPSTTPSDVPTRLVYYSPTRLSDAGMDGFDFSEWGQGIHRLHPVIQGSVVVCNNFYHVWESHSNEGFKSAKSNDQSSKDTWASVSSGLKIVNHTIYLFGLKRKVFMRSSFGQWQDLSDEIKHPNLFEDIADRQNQSLSLFGHPIGFRCFDGFDEKELYAGGINGDFWHYNGLHWQKRHLPSDNDIINISCASDGFVYVVDESSKIIKGRLGQWQVLDLNNAFFTQGENSTAWFQDQLYLISNSELCVLEENTIRPVSFPSKWSYVNVEHVKASADALMCYGLHSAYLFDGKEWQKII